MNVVHPAAKMVNTGHLFFRISKLARQFSVWLILLTFQLVELSRSQDIEAGDGTTSVVVIAGSLLEAAEKLLYRGIHPSAISDAFQRAATKCVEILTKMSRPIEMNDRESLIQSASTSLNSKVVSQHSSQLAPLAVDADLKVILRACVSGNSLKSVFF
jgi:T-complex protein 1 subunit delta